MIFQRKNSESALDRLERECNDDFRLLDELGPSHFGVEHLLELRERSFARIDQFLRRQKFIMMLGGTAAAWIFMAFIAKLMNYIWLSFASFGLGALSIMAFLALLLLQQKQFGTKGDLDYIQRIIEDELKRRVGRVPQNPRPKR
ncbi:MAG: hypothetical protein KGS48_01995 [Bacteroidetes bacterium]|nr:hypothetical protein [Bacteroidota bacterium]